MENGAPVYTDLIKIMRNIVCADGIAVFQAEWTLRSG